MTMRAVPEFSKESIVTAIGVTVVQGLDFMAPEMKLNVEDTQQLWSPYLAATARLIRPADDMAGVFQHSAKSEMVKSAIANEIEKPHIELYEPFNDSLRSYLKMITESVAENSYLPAVENRGLVNKQQMASELMEMLNFYFQDQNAKGRKVLATDEVFKILYCTALPQHVEDTMQGNALNGITNTGQMVQLGQVVFGTALVLQIIKGMID